MSDDPYVYPGTDVLRNSLGISDDTELKRVETDLVYWRSLRLASRPIPGNYDLSHLQAFHCFLFEGLYAWAGELRTVPLARTDLFCLPEHIDSYAAEIFDRLAEERQLVGLDHEVFVDRLAHYLAEVNALHPFREGNGRAQRAFFAQLAVEADYCLDWQPVDPQRNIDASIAAMRGEEGPLRELLNEIVAPVSADPSG